MPTTFSLLDSNLNPTRHATIRLIGVAILVCALLISGCSRDPNVRKQKFVAQGDAYFKAGKYPEAQITYARALQIDSRYVLALYKSAQCSMRLGNWNSAYQELLRTVDLEPTNWPAQLDLGKLYLGSGRLQAAKERALLILRSGPANVDAKILLSDAAAGLGNQKDALNEGREAIDAAPNNAMALLNMVVLQQRSGAYQ